MRDEKRMEAIESKIKEYAKEKGLMTQVVLQIYLYERLLERFSVSAYRRKFMVRGGMLYAAIAGYEKALETGAVFTLRSLTLTREEAEAAVQEICEIDLNDDVAFRVKQLQHRGVGEQVNRFEILLVAAFGKALVPLSIEIEKETLAAPLVQEYTLRGLLDQEKTISFWGYSVETLLAEKTASILNSGMFGSKAGDFYELYFLSTVQTYDKILLREVLFALEEQKKSDLVGNLDLILHRIAGSRDAKQSWQRYRKTHSNVRDVSFEEVQSILYTMIGKDSYTKRKESCMA